MATSSSPMAAATRFRTFSADCAIAANFGKTSSIQPYRNFPGPSFRCHDRKTGIHRACLSICLVPGFLSELSRPPISACLQNSEVWPQPTLIKRSASLQIAAREQHSWLCELPVGAQSSKQYALLNSSKSAPAALTSAPFLCASRGFKSSPPRSPMCARKEELSMDLLQLIHHAVLGDNANQPQEVFSRRFALELQTR